MDVVNTSFHTENHFNITKWMFSTLLKNGFLEVKKQSMPYSLTEKFDTVILDPPRIGCEDSVIKNVISLEPKIIILISCSPENFCEDVYKIVSSNQYIIDKIIPIDMFPQTHHTEIVGIFRLK